MKWTLLFPVFLFDVSSGLEEEKAQCYMPIDVIFLQDTTGSFLEDLPIVTRQIPAMVEQILVQNPNSHFGVAEFKDKPYFPLGSMDDACYKLNGPLSASVQSFQNAYADLYASGGGDLPEAQYQALIHLAEDPRAGWRPLHHFPQGVSEEDSEFAGARLIIMSTDALPHLSGDVRKFHKLFPKTVPGDLGDNPGTTINKDADYLCSNTDYPTPQQVRDALRKNSIYLAILTPNEPEIVGAWKWVNEQLLGQPAGFYQFIESDSSDIMKGVLQVMQEVTITACTETTTTTTTTTTTRPTTTTTTRPTTTTTTRPTTTTTTTRPTTTTTTTRPTTTTTTTTPTTTTTTTPTTTTTTTPATTTTTTTTTPATTTTIITTTAPPGTRTAQPTTTRPASQPSTARPSTTVASGTARSSTTGQATTTMELTTDMSEECMKTCEEESRDPCEEDLNDPCSKHCCKQPAVRFELLEKPKRLALEFE